VVPAGTAIINSSYKYIMPLRALLAIPANRDGDSSSGRSGEDKPTRSVVRVAGRAIPARASRQAARRQLRIILLSCRADVL